MLSILPFLIQWLSLSRPGNNHDFQLFNSRYPQKSHWTLLSEFQQLPDDEIEKYLPQICNIILDRDSSLNDYGLYDQFEQILVERCAKSFPFGLRLSGYLKATSSGSSESLFTQVLSSSNTNNQQREERLRILQEHAEAATANGYQLPHRMNTLRSYYYRDYQFMLETLTRLGIELKSSPVEVRNNHLREALSDFNDILYSRMLTGGSVDYSFISYNNMNMNQGNSLPKYNLQQVAGTPNAVAYSLHFPLQRGSDEVIRLLRVVESECHVLQSKERCPYLLVVEVLREPHLVRSDHLFCHGHTIGVTLEDVLTGRILPPMSPELRAENHPSSDDDSGNGGEAAGNFEISKLTSGLGASLRQASAEEEEDRISTNTAKAAASSSTSIEYETNHANTDYDTDFSRSSSKSFSGSDFARPSVELMDPAFPNDGGGPSVVDGEFVVPIPGLGTQSKMLGGGLGTRAGGGSAMSYEDSVADYSDSRSRSPVWNANQSRMPHQSSGQYDTPPNSPPSPPWPQQQQQNLHPSHSSHTSDADLASAYYPASPMVERDFGTNAYQSPNRFQTQDSSIDYYSHPPHQQQQQHMPSMPQVSSFRPAIISRQTWAEKREFIRRSSVFGHLPGWDLKACIVKSGDDLRKEVLAMQLISLIKEILKSEGIDVYLRPYQIMSTDRGAGFVEYVEGAQSIDRIKKSIPDMPTLKRHFERSFGPSYSPLFSKAVSNFVKSLAGYSLVTYILQVKDRHNANIMVEADGHLVHIDFGFILGDSPGFNINFENAPFKLTREYVELLGGLDSAAFKAFEDLFLRGFLALQRHHEALCAVVELFYGTRRRSAGDAMRARLLFARTHGDILSLIRDSFDSWRTKQYDWFQHRTNNIQM